MAENPVPPADPATQLLALIGQYTAEVSAFSHSLSPDAEDDDLDERQRRLDELRQRIAALRAEALKPKPPAGGTPPR